MRYIYMAALVAAILAPTNVEAARHDRSGPKVTRDFNMDRPKRPMKKHRRPHHVKGDFWDVFPIPGLIPAIRMITRG